MEEGTHGATHRSPVLQCVVTLVLKTGEHKLRSVEAATWQLAALMAEELEPGSRAINVSVTWWIRTRCGRCGAVIFEGETPRERNGKPRYYDCE